VAAGSTRLADFGPPGWLDGIELDGTKLADLDLPDVMRAHAYGGGPGAFDGTLDEALAGWAAHRRWQQDWQAATRAADADLAAAATKVTETPAEPA
jgi:argininosuccinate lyase